MKLAYINTKRNFEHRFFFDLVYEWENIISKTLDVPLYHEYRPYLMYKNMRNKYLCKIPVLRELLYPHGLSLSFDMDPVDKPRFNSKNIIPWIIDFYLPKEKLPQFNEAYKGHPLVLISCLDAYNYLLENKDLCPDVKIKHLALSLPDQYAFDKKFLDKKIYDVALVGNQECLMKNYFDRYVSENPDVTFVYRENKNGEFQYYTNKSNTSIGGGNRSDYINIIRSSKVTLYATSMLYGSREGYNNFNHVTPRFFEMLAAGCHVLCRYIPNKETDYFELEQFSQSIETYEQFEKLMNEAIKNPIDSSKYEDYLAKHYTSVRAKQLNDIISSL